MCLRISLSLSPSVFVNLRISCFVVNVSANNGMSQQTLILVMVDVYSSAIYCCCFCFDSVSSVLFSVLCERIWLIFMLVFPISVRKILYFVYSFFTRFSVFKCERRKPLRKGAIIAIHSMTIKSHIRSCQPKNSSTNNELK